MSQISKCMSITRAIVPDVVGFNMHFCNCWFYKLYGFTNLLVHAFLIWTDFKRSFWLET